MEARDTAYTTETDTCAVLAELRDRLHHRGVEAIGPFPGWPSPYLELEDGRRVHARLDRNGYWQALVFEGRDVVRMADIDGSDWPGDPT